MPLLWGLWFWLRPPLFPVRNNKNEPDCCESTILIHKVQTSGCQGPGFIHKHYCVRLLLPEIIGKI